MLPKAFRAETKDENNTPRLSSENDLILSINQSMHSMQIIGKIQSAEKHSDQTNDLEIISRPFESIAQKRKTLKYY
ncbi:hypothetical protein QR98_0070570 [Sarcoptes scabiei]|uniref:Uncharacterized protein n=1 Tax=Sarcoptes scabiei TaxID=52283 RepID=A0A132AD78_SARSC|nr:hypothetical protein QR98_0070570 [Sarcoptes scabiei]